MNPPDSTSQTVIDLVCGMTVDPATARSHLHEGKPYYFCAEKCRIKFIADPQHYLSPAPVIVEVAKPGTEYTCPMDPEIVRDAPGACPICGMALEPRTITLDDAENPELIDMTRRFKVSLVLTLPLLIATMGAMVPGLNLHHALGATIFGWL